MTDCLLSNFMNQLITSCDYLVCLAKNSDSTGDFFDNFLLMTPMLLFARFMSLQVCMAVLEIFFVVLKGYECLLFGHNFNFFFNIQLVGHVTKLNIYFTRCAFVGFLVMLCDVFPELLVVFGFFELLDIPCFIRKYSTTTLLDFMISYGIFHLCLLPMT